MVFEQTLILKNALFPLPESPKPPSSNPIYSLYFFASPSTPNIKRPGHPLAARCAIEHSSSDYVHSAAYPKPSEIPWQKDLCNTVHLVGVVGKTLQIKLLSAGKTIAWTSLGVKKSATEIMWVNLTFWDELAHVANQHVQKGNQIYVSGKLVSDVVESEDGKKQTYYKVFVSQLNFVEKNWLSTEASDGDFNSITKGRGHRSSFGTITTGSIEELWQAFFANPSVWWDNRRNKRSPKSPDFKHKDTGEALWIENKYNPPWVKSQLAILDSKMESFGSQDSGMHPAIISADKLF